MTKKTYGQVFLGMILLIIAAVAGDVFLLADNPILIGLASLIASVTMFVCSILRLQDVGWSPWWVLLMLIPIAGFVLVAILIFKTGKEQASDRGAA
jgi:uncharacterized membrane protein YhaH (DUF805 family)